MSLKFIFLPNFLLFSNCLNNNVLFKSLIISSFNHQRYQKYSFLLFFTLERTSARDQRKSKVTSQNLKWGYNRLEEYDFPFHYIRQIFLIYRFY